jgi:hypothetical protein
MSLWIIHVTEIDRLINIFKEGEEVIFLKDLRLLEKDSLVKMTRISLIRNLESAERLGLKRCSKLIRTWLENGF